MASGFTVLFDSCVLFSAPLRDLMLELSTTGLFRGRWSADIHREWIGAVLQSRPDVTREKLERTRDKMDACAGECLVAGYADLIPALSLPDPDDRHVLAAAIRCGADVIVTKNLDDFPTGVLSKFGIEPQHPDEFIEYLLSLDAATVCHSVKTIRGRLKNPPRSAEEYLATLGRQELPRTVATLRAFLSAL